MPASQPATPDGRTGAGRLPYLRRHLLRLINPAAAIEAGSVVLAEDDWDTIDSMAAAHRLQPLLGWLHRDDAAIPGPIRQRWTGARRLAAAEALRSADELRRVTALLETAGFAPIALKGAWLAWHAYPEPSLRPMRDLDLLLPGDTALPAFHLLLANGYRLEDGAHLPEGGAAQSSKHLPPLLSPGGIWLELHQRLAEPAGRMDHRAPVAPLAVAGDRAMIVGGIRFLEPTDLVAHLVIHAAYDHRLDCGPLVLTDLSYAIGATKIDWPRFWDDARVQHWDRGARLVLELVCDFDPDCGVEFPPGQEAAPAELRALAPDLMLQDLDTRQSAGVLATTRVGGWRGLVRRALRKRAGHDDPHSLRPDFAVRGGYLNWALSRLSRTVRELAQTEVRRQSGKLAALSGWLDGAGGRRP